MNASDRRLSALVHMRLYVVAMVMIVCRVQLGSASVNSACKCVLFNSTFDKEYGVFHSPNWPQVYEDNINCLLYTFHSRPDQIIEVTFDEFDVQRANLECVYRDYVKLFLNLPQASVNENNTHNHLLCGRIVDIEQTFYSSHPALAFEFHSDWRNGNNTGFRGSFRFLAKKWFETDGELKNGTLCEFTFDSSQMDRKSGKFFSPQYPSSYPKNSRCKYTFVGQPNQRIKLVFDYVNLQRNDISCLLSPDVILVHDGLNSSAPLIAQLCNRDSFVELSSSDHQLHVQFVAKSLFPGQGFRASYMFEQVQQPAYLLAPPASLSAPGASSNCNQWFTSDQATHGTFYSPNYPNSYPAHLHCVYNFTGKGRERVQIVFNDFSVYKPEDTDKDCNGADVLMAYITINGQRKRLDNLCGDDLPKQLMSNDNSITLEFKTFHATEHHRGFSANFSFITNFAITSGQQDHQQVCGFFFTSRDNPNGTFTSPNFPGFYPRDTECHYFFYGEPTEKVYITFTDFKVEGISPCTTETASDYVEFSNYKTVDRKIPRHCGSKKPVNIESDGDFFRISFKSNDRFDETGFKAFYEFKKPEETNPTKQVRQIPSGVIELQLNSLIFVISLWLCLIGIKF